MASEFGTGKSILILAIVAGCFAILWPNIFYPMLVGNQVPKQEIPGNGCCDVIFDTDVNAIKLMTELCERILSRDADFDRKFIYAFRQGKLTKEIIRTCQKIVLDKCDVDITEFLNEKVRLGRTYKQMLDEIRSLNSSLCLKQTFGISFKQIGLPRTVRIWGINQPKHLRQERPPHLHPEFLHPALREKGRAIPQSHVVPKIKHQDGRPGPIPGIRPPMGGAGHVVPPPKGSGTMGIVMPMYTIGIVVFFMYTMMRIIFKKSDSSSYDGFTPDPDFQRAVFGDRANKGFANGKEPVEETTKLGDLELDLLKKRLQETEKAMERIVAKMMSLPHNHSEKEESEKEKGESESEKKEIDEIQSALDEMIEDEVEDGGKGAVPSQSQLLVSDSHTETLPAEEDHAVVLTGKVTLSLIGLENEEGSGYAVSASDEIKKLDNVEEKAGGENGMENDTNLENNESDFSTVCVSANKTTEIKCDKTNTSAENEEMKEAKDNIVTTDDDGEVEEVEEDLEQDVEEEVEEEEEIGNVDEVENVEEEGEDEEDEEEGEDVDDEKEGEDDKEGGEEEEYEDEIENEEEEEAPYQNENVKSVGSK